MGSLRAAASASDAVLDLALLRIGILAPADLDEIRALISRPAALLQPSTNADGHRIVDVIERNRSIAQIHHDGRVLQLSAA